VLEVALLGNPRRNGAAISSCQSQFSRFWEKARRAMFPEKG